MIVILFILIVVVFWTALCYSKYKKWHIRMKKCTRLVHGLVIEVKERKPIRGSGMLYKPIFMVRDENGETKIESAYYPNPISLSVNSKVDLLVDPNDYNTFIYADRSLNKGLPADIICCCLPIVFLVGILLLS